MEDERHTHRRRKMDLYGGSARKAVLSIANNAAVAVTIAEIIIGFSDKPDDPTAAHAAGPTIAPGATASVTIPVTIPKGGIEYPLNVWLVIQGAQLKFGAGTIRAFLPLEPITIQNMPPARDSIPSVKAAGDIFNTGSLMAHEIEAKHTALGRDKIGTSLMTGINYAADHLKLLRDAGIAVPNTLTSRMQALRKVELNSLPQLVMRNANPWPVEINFAYIMLTTTGQGTEIDSFGSVNGGRWQAIAEVDANGNLQRLSRGDNLLLTALIPPKSQKTLPLMNSSPPDAPGISAFKVVWGDAVGFEPTRGGVVALISPPLMVAEIYAAPVIAPVSIANTFQGNSAKLTVDMKNPNPVPLFLNGGLALRSSLQAPWALNRFSTARSDYVTLEQREINGRQALVVTAMPAAHYTTATTFIDIPINVVGQPPEVRFEIYIPSDYPDSLPSAAHVYPAVMFQWVGPSRSWNRDYTLIFPKGAWSEQVIVPEVPLSIIGGWPTRAVRTHFTPRYTPGRNDNPTMWIAIRNVRIQTEYASRTLKPGDTRLELDGFQLGQEPGEDTVVLGTYILDRKIETSVKTNVFRLPTLATSIRRP